MKEVFNKMIQHPFRTAMVIGGITSGVVTILNAVQKMRK